MASASCQVAHTLSFRSPTATGRGGSRVQISGMFLSALPSVKPPDIASPERGGGWRTRHGCISSHRVSGAQAWLWPSGSTGQPGPDALARAVVSLRRCWLRSSAHRPEGVSEHVSVRSCPLTINQHISCWSLSGQVETRLPLEAGLLAPPPHAFLLSGKVSSCLGPNPTRWGHCASLTLQNEQERECLDCQADCENGALCDREGGPASRAERPAAGQGGEERAGSRQATSGSRALPVPPGPEHGTRDPAWVTAKAGHAVSK